MVLKPNKGETLRKENPRLYQQIAASQFDVFKLLNNRIGQVKIGGKVRFVDMADDALAFYSKADMALILGHITVLDWNCADVPAFRWWLVKEDRRQFNQVVFEPDPKRAKPGALNMFRGFGVAPEAKASGWTILEDHIRRNLCRDDKVAAEWLLDWMAHLFQRPGVKIGVAPILYGSKGCGKSVVMDILAECIGADYAPVVDTPEGLTAKHNAHLAKAVLIRVEEALHARDPRHDARLKNLITGGRITIEPKGVDAFEIDSKCNLMFASNKAHSVPASGGERRFFALHCGDGNRQDGPFFRELRAQMRDGGYAAFVHDLMARDIEATDFSKPPVTALLSTQILSSMTGLEKWWAATLSEGRLPFVREPDGVSDADMEWPDIARRGDGVGNQTGAWSVPKAIVQESATAFARGYDGPPTPEAVGRFLTANVPGMQRDRRQTAHDRQHIYVLPPLEDCRQAFVEARPGLLLDHVTDSMPATAVAATTATARAHPEIGSASRKVIPLRAA